METSKSQAYEDAHISRPEELSVETHQCDFVDNVVFGRGRKGGLQFELDRSACVEGSAPPKWIRQKGAENDTKGEELQRGRRQAMDLPAQNLGGGPGAYIRAKDLTT